LKIGGGLPNVMKTSLLRILDILLSIIGIIMTAPIMLAIYLIALILNGSPLFLQRRIGKKQIPFTLIKFRTMRLNTKSIDTHLVDTSSITKFGAFLRRTKLDELPQLFNVFQGEMSLVGPRPGLQSQNELTRERAKRAIFRINPGITGLAQVNNIDMSTPRKLARYDLIMVQNMSLKLYLKIILVTALGKGRGDRVKY